MGTVSGTVTAAADAAIGSLASLSGTVTAGGEADVLSLGSVNMSVNAQDDVLAWAYSPVTIDLTSTHGSGRDRNVPKVCTWLRVGATSSNLAVIARREAAFGSVAVAADRR